jgi:hypothetical protein
MCLLNSRVHTVPQVRFKTGVCLTAYSGGARDLPARVLQEFLDAVTHEDRMPGALHLRRHGIDCQACGIDLERRPEPGRILVVD